MFLQVGNPIVAEKDGFFTSTLNTNSESLNSVLKFYTAFADPLQNVYSWNKSFPSSQDAFSKEDLTFYFGFASELESLVNKNPNQNFMVAPIPQIRNSNLKVTKAQVLGLAITSATKNFTTAFTAAGLLSSGDFAAKLANAMGIAPARRDLIKNIPTDAYLPTFYASALFAKSWLDPLPKDSDTIFRGMVEKVLSGSMSVAEAVSDANSKLGLLLVK